MMIINIPLSRIVANPWQTRIGEPDPEYIKSLALDIAANGLLQVPVGRLRNSDGSEVYIDWPVNYARLKDLIELGERHVQLAFGHNRLAAYKWLHELKDNSNIKGDFSEMSVDIRTLDDTQMAVMAWSENENRKDVTPIERATAIERRMADFGWNQHEVADYLGIARPTVANILRLLKLPQHMQDALQDGRMSARVGSALLPMYELPKEVISMANNDWQARPRDIEQKALSGQSSDLIRKEVERLYQFYTQPLQKAEFGLDELFEEGLPVLGYDFEGSGVKVYCGLCRTCDRRLKDTGNICLDIGCYKAKETLHRREYLARAAGACGIQAVDPNKGGTVTFFSAYTQTDIVLKIINSKCENLRLVYEVNPGDKVTNVAGHPHAKIVCDKRNNSCSCIKGFEIAARKSEPSKAVDQAIQAEKEQNPDHEGEEDQDPEMETEPVRAQTTMTDPKQLEELARQARLAKKDIGRQIEKAKEKVEAVLFDGFQNHQPGAYYLAARNYPYPNRGDLDLERIYRTLARRFVEVIIPSDANDVDQLYEIINRKLTGLELDAVYPYATLVETLGKDDELNG